jgi:hypothetical protein
MNQLLATIKWETIKWCNSALRYLLMALPFLLVLWLNPIPRDPMAGDTLILYDLAILLFMVMPSVVGLLLIVFYPIFSMAIYAYMPYAMMEHGSARPMAMVLSVRMLLNMLTFWLGIGLQATLAPLFERYGPISSAWSVLDLSASDRFTLVLIFLAFSVWMPILIMFIGLILRSTKSCKLEKVVLFMLYALFFSTVFLAMDHIYGSHGMDGYVLVICTILTLFLYTFYCWFHEHTISWWDKVRRFFVMAEAWIIKRRFLLLILAVFTIALTIGVTTFIRNVEMDEFMRSVRNEGPPASPTPGGHSIDHVENRGFAAIQGD